MSRTYTAAELKAILDDHSRWLRGDGGARANLRYADLSSANLSYANLSSADLSYADLSSANLSSADLSSAKNTNSAYGLVRSVLPEEGDFICYKKVAGDVVLTLLVPEYAARVTPWSDRKSRVSHATPIRAETMDGRPVAETSFKSIHDPLFVYIIGQLAEVKDFDASPDVVCTRGLHCYNSKQEARVHT